LGPKQSNRRYVSARNYECGRFNYALAKYEKSVSCNVNGYNPERGSSVIHTNDAKSKREINGELREICMPRNTTPELLSEQLLNAIEQRCNQATQGPWISFIEARDEFSGSDFIRTAGEDIYLTGATPADHDFIAASRQDVPLLIAEIRRMRTLLSAK
jgi:hypothetical protein